MSRVTGHGDGMGYKTVYLTLSYRPIIIKGASLMTEDDASGSSTTAIDLRIVVMAFYSMS